MSSLTNITVGLWRVLCIAENKMVDIQSIDVPTLCPNDHPDRSIDHNRTIRWGSVSNQNVNVIDPTPGNFQYMNLDFTVPAGAQNDETHHDFEWAADILVSTTEFIPQTEHLNDRIDVIVAPDHDAGAITSDALTGAQIMNVDDDVLAFEALTKGVELKVENNGMSQNLGVITSIDRQNKQIGFETPLTADYPTGSRVLMNVCLIKNGIIYQTTHPIKVGEKGFRNKLIPAGTKLRFCYTNSSGLEKRVVVTMQYNYF